MRRPEATIRRLLGAGSGPLRAGGLAGAGARAGAYVLLIRLDAPLALNPRHRLPGLAAGVYAYAGSARGPGGIAARLARHFRPDKTPHWHVDALTLAAGDLSAFAAPAGDECELGRRLAASGDFAPVAPGFGASDCRKCVSHLLAWPG